MPTVSRLVSAYAIALAAAGVACLFAPDWVALAFGLAGEAPGTALLVQIVGGALIAFGSSNWFARGTTLGGIYQRPVVGANQMFAVVGALVLAKSRPEAAGTGYWALFVLLALGAVLHSALLYRGPFPRAAESVRDSN